MTVVKRKPLALPAVFRFTKEKAHSGECALVVFSQNCLDVVDFGVKMVMKIKKGRKIRKGSLEKAEKTKGFGKGERKKGK